MKSGFRSTQVRSCPRLPVPVVPRFTYVVSTSKDTRSSACALQVEAYVHRSLRCSMHRVVLATASGGSVVQYPTHTRSMRNGVVPRWALRRFYEPTQNAQSVPSGKTYICATQSLTGDTRSAFIRQDLFGRCNQHGTSLMLFCSRWYQEAERLLPSAQQGKPVMVHVACLRKHAVKMWTPENVQRKHARSDRRSGFISNNGLSSVQARCPRRKFVQKIETAAFA